MKKPSLSDLFGENPSPEAQEIIQRAADKVCEYLGYVNNFVPTVEQPYALSDTEYFKLKEQKDAE